MANRRICNGCNNALLWRRSGLQDAFGDGFIETGVGRVIHIANTRSKTVPHGFSQEETFKAIWSAGMKQKPARQPSLSRRNNHAQTKKQVEEAGRH